MPTFTKTPQVSRETKNLIDNYRYIGCTITSKNIHYCQANSDCIALLHKEKKGAELKGRAGNKQNLFTIRPFRRLFEITGLILGNATHTHNPVFRIEVH
jgi:hypothetical protein